MILALLIISQIPECPTKPDYPKADLLRIQESGSIEMLDGKDCKHGFYTSVDEPTTKKLCIYCVPQRCFSTTDSKVTCYPSR